MFTIYTSNQKLFFHIIKKINLKHLRWSIVLNGKNNKNCCLSSFYKKETRNIKNELIKTEIALERNKT